MRAIDTRRILCRRRGPVPLVYADRFAGDRHPRTTQRPAAEFGAGCFARQRGRAVLASDNCLRSRCGSSAALAISPTAVAAYAVERPRVLTDMPAPDAAELAQSGMAIVCFAEDAACRDRAIAQGPAGRRVGNRDRAQFSAILRQAAALYDLHRAAAAMTGPPMEFAPRVLRPHLGPVERLVDALTDPARRERTALAVLAAYAAIWTLYGVLSKAAQGVQSDTAELVDWSHHLALGYAKHPPLPPG